jgi:hypothetical protein
MPRIDSVAAAVRLSAAMLIGAALAVGVVQAQPTTPSEPQSAHWVQKKLFFVFQGFTTTYTCEGLRDLMRSVLEQLGARSDLEIMDSGCVGGNNSFQPHPGVSASFYVLEPASTGQEPLTVDAHWAPMRVKVGSTYLIQQGQCELIEQIRHQVLPLFSTRNVDFKNSSCFPHQLSIAGTDLRAEVLMPNSQRSAQANPPPG